MRKGSEILNRILSRFGPTRFQLKYPPPQLLLLVFGEVGHPEGLVPVEEALVISGNQSSLTSQNSSRRKSPQRGFQADASFLQPPGVWSACLGTNASCQPVYQLLMIFIKSDYAFAFLNWGQLN